MPAALSTLTPTFAWVITYKSRCHLGSQSGVTAPLLFPAASFIQILLSHGPPWWVSSVFLCGEHRVSPDRRSVRSLHACSDEKRSSCGAGFGACRRALWHGVISSGWPPSADVGSGRCCVTTSEDLLSAPPPPPRCLINVWICLFFLYRRHWRERSHRIFHNYFLCRKSSMLFIHLFQNCQTFLLQRG